MKSWGWSSSLRGGVGSKCVLKRLRKGYWSISTGSGKIVLNSALMNVLRKRKTEKKSKASCLKGDNLLVLLLAATLLWDLSQRWTRTTKHVELMTSPKLAIPSTYAAAFSKLWKLKFMSNVLPPRRARELFRPGSGTSVITRKIPFHERKAKKEIKMSHFIAKSSEDRGDI